MSLTRPDSSELPPTTFVRGSTFRKSFMIRNRNSKLPPSALIFMKSLEKTKVNQFDSLKAYENISLEESKPTSSNRTSNGYELKILEDESPLISKTSAFKRRNSLRKSSGKKKLNINKIISFFKK